MSFLKKAAGIKDEIVALAVRQLEDLLVRHIGKGGDEHKVVTKTEAGFAPASGSAPSGYVLKTTTGASPTWQPDATGGGGGGGVTDGDKGDVTVSGGGTVWAVDPLPESRIIGLVSDLANKSPLVHGHGVADITGLAAIATSGSGADLTAGSVTNAKLDSMPAGTVKGNNTGSPATPADLTPAQLTSLLGLYVDATVSPGAPASSFSFTVTDPLVTPTSKIALEYGTTNDTDVNTPEMDSWVGHVTSIGSGTFSARITNPSGHRLAGLIKYRYLRA